MSHNAVLTLFSLQHAGDDDAPAYRKAAAMLAPGGIVLSVCEYDPGGARRHESRDDGAMRIYGPKDIEERIERPLREGGVEILEKRFAGFVGNNKTIVWCDGSTQIRGSEACSPAFLFLRCVKKTMEAEVL